MKPVTRSKIRRELEEAGLKVTLYAMTTLEDLGLYSLQKVRKGKRYQYVTSREEAEKIKRLIWAYYYNDKPYTDDINYG